MFDYTNLFFAQWLCPCGQCDHQPVFKTITWLLLSRLPRRNSLEPSEPCVRNLHQHRNPPEPTCLRNLHQHTPELAGTLRTLRNLPPKPTPATELELSGTLRNSPEPSTTCLWNLHQHTPEPSGTFRNLSPEPAPATRTGTHQILSRLKTPWAYAAGENKLWWYPQQQ